MTETTHNPPAELHRVSCLRENLTSSSYGEELETGPTAWSGTAPVPYPTVVLQMDQAASAHQGVFRHQRERGENANLDRHSVYVLVAIVKKRLGVAASLYTILQILSLTLFEKKPLDQLLNDIALQNLDPVDSNQLNLFS